MSFDSAVKRKNKPKRKKSDIGEMSTQRIFKLTSSKIFKTTIVQTCVSYIIGDYDLNLESTEK